MYALEPQAWTLQHWHLSQRKWARLPLFSVVSGITITVLVNQVSGVAEMQAIADIAELGRSFTISEWIDEMEGEPDDAITERELVDSMGSD